MKKYIPFVINVGSKIHKLLEVTEKGYSRNYAEDAINIYKWELSTSKLNNLNNILPIDAIDHWNITKKLHNKLSELFEQNDWLILLPSIDNSNITIEAIILDNKDKAKIITYIEVEQAEKIEAIISSCPNFLVKFKTEEQMLLFKILWNGN